MLGQSVSQSVSQLVSQPVSHCSVYAFASIHCLSLMILQAKRIPLISFIHLI
jgi:hypothetical protein